MSKTRRTFTDEFKREAVALLEGSGRPLMQVAAELGIQPSMLRSWRAVARGTAPGVPADAPASASATPRLPSPAEQAAEIARLKRELDRTRQEREVLKKAIAIFSEAPR
jgi:transposase